MILIDVTLQCDKCKKQGISHQAIRYIPGQNMPEFAIPCEWKVTRLEGAWFTYCPEC